MTITAPLLGTTAAVAATGVHKTYGHGDTAVRALDGLTVAFARGEFAAVMGPSGSGKSTLLHCLAGLDNADGGSIVIDDVDLTTLNEKQRTLLRRDRLGFVFQAFNLIPSLTAAENITLPLTLAGRRADPDWLATLVDTLRLGDRLAHRPAELSGGQQQRVAVARALVTRPAIVFADEPTGNLDSRHGSQLLAFLRQAVGQFGQTVVMVTHDPVAASYTDRVVFLADGRTADDLADPSVDTVLARMKRFDNNQ
jgi:putative ABC transport system ATP-binding protein